jgi:hypothetical protein
MLDWFKKKASNILDVVGHGAKNVWETVGHKAKNINNAVNKVASTVSNITDKYKYIPFVSDVNNVANDVVRYSDMFGKGLDFGDRVVNTLERVSKRGKDTINGNMTPNDFVDNTFNDGRQILNDGRQLYKDNRRRR